MGRISSCEQGQWPRERLVKVRHILMTIMNSLECFPDKNDLFRFLVIWCASACVIFTVIPQILQWAKPLMWLASMFFLYLSWPLAFHTICKSLPFLVNFPFGFTMQWSALVISVLCPLSMQELREKLLGWICIELCILSSGILAPCVTGLDLTSAQRDKQAIVSWPASCTRHQWASEAITKHLACQQQYVDNG